MLWDDLADYPMNFFIECEFTGQVDREVFVQALEMARARHPLLAAVVDRGARGGPAWVSAGSRRPVIEWHDIEPTTPQAWPSIDLESGVGLCVRVYQSPSRVRMLFEFHHACLDGVASLQFLGDLLAVYHLLGAPGDTEAELAPLDASKLLVRGRFPPPPPTGEEPPPPPHNAWTSAVESAKFFAARVTPLAPAATAALDHGQRVRPLETWTCDDETFRRLRAIAASRNATLNNLLLQQLFLALAEWNRGHSGVKDSAMFRIAMPVNLRTVHHAGIPAACVMSYSFLDRRVSDFADESFLLETVRGESLSIQRGSLARGFIEIISAVARLPLVLPAVLRLTPCLTTAVLSNVGDPTRQFLSQVPRLQRRVAAGGLVLENITGAPPIRRGTRASLGVSTYNGRLSISARTDPRLFGPGDFFHDYVARLQRLA